MSLKRNNFVVGCEQCAYALSDGAGSFIVTVPLRDKNSGIEGTARLQCRVSPFRHEVALKRWLDKDQQSVRPNADAEKRLLQALDYIADKRVCGNRHLCPPEVVRTVEQHGRR